MTRCALLLRGVNVGGHNRVAMADLREMLTGLGCTDVATYLQSGNAVATTTAPVDDLARDVASRLGVAVLARTTAQLQRVVADNPFPDVEDPTRLAVAFVSDPPTKSAVEQLDHPSYAPDELRLGPGVLYVHYPQGQGRATLKPAVLDRLGGVVTVRNWRTVQALLRLAQL